MQRRYYDQFKDELALYGARLNNSNEQDLPSFLENIPELPEQRYIRLTDFPPICGGSLMQNYLDVLQASVLEEVVCIHNRGTAVIPENDSLIHLDDIRGFIYEKDLLIKQPTTLRGYGTWFWFQTLSQGDVDGFAGIITEGNAYILTLGRNLSSPKSAREEMARYTKRHKHTARMFDAEDFMKKVSALFETAN